MLHIYAVLAQKERALISERTKAALRAAKAQGTVLGNPRLSEAAARGTAAGKSRADQFAANLLPLVREIQKAGASSLNAIADALNKRGIRTARGKEWTPCAGRPCSRPLSPVHQPDSMITQARMGCGMGRVMVNGVCQSRAGMRQERRAMRRCARWHGGVCVK